MHNEMALSLAGPRYGHPYGSHILLLEQPVLCLYTSLCPDCQRHPLAIGWFIVPTRVDSTCRALRGRIGHKSLVVVTVGAKSLLDSISFLHSGAIRRSGVGRFSSITRAVYFHRRFPSCQSLWKSPLTISLKRWQPSQKVNHKVRIPSTDPMQPNTTVPTSLALHPDWLWDSEAELGVDEAMA